MKERKIFGKRLLALLLVLVTAISSWSIDWSTLMALAADSSALSDSGHQIYSGGAIAQLYESTVDYTQLTEVTFRVGVDAGETVTYKVDVYQNLTSTADPTVGVHSYTGSGFNTISRTDTTVDSAESVTFDLSGAGIYLSDGETAAVVITLASSGGDGVIDYYASTAGGSGYQKSASSGTWEGPQSDCAVLSTTPGIGSESVPSVDSISLSSKTVILGAGESADVTASLSPAYKRSISVSGYDSSIADVSVSDETVHITANNSNTAGSTTVTVTASGGASPASSTITVKVLSCSLSQSSYDYDGTAKTPVVTVSDGSTTYTSDSFSSQFSVAYSNNVNAGTASVTVTGLSSGNYSGFSWTGSFVIAAKSLTDSTLTSYVNSGSYTVNTSTNTVTAATVNGLTFGTDYVVTATRTSTSTYGMSLTYDLVVTGTGNYKDSVTISGYTVYTASSGTTIDISEIVTMSLSETEYTYDGTAKTPTVTFLDISDGETKVSLPTNCVTVTYSNNIAAGEATVTATGITSAGYTGTLTETFYIAKATLPNVATLSLDTDIWVYTGSAITPVETVTRSSDGVALTKGTDYTVKYSNNTSVGTATLTVNGTGNYKGSIKTNFEIVGALATQAVVEIGSSSASYSNGFVSGYTKVYSGSAITPNVSVSVSSIYLTENTDYTVAYYNNTDAGTAQVVITGIGNYTGQSVTAYFTISQKTLTGQIKLSDAATKTYNGNAQTQTGYTVLTNGKVLTENSDYTISYSNNTNAGTATITATGMGNYTGSISNSFAIEKLDISNCTASVADQVYTGSAITPAPTLLYGSMTLGSDVGYTVEYSNNTKIGTATVTLTGNTNLTGTLETTFAITPRDVGSLSYTIGGVEAGTGTGDGAVIYSDYATQYNGAYQTPSIKVKDGTTTLKAGTDYSVKWANNKAVADKSSTDAPRVVITGLDTYEGTSVTICFSITTRDISDDDVAVSENGTVSSTDLTPVLVLTDGALASGSKTLTEGTDYSVTYASSTAAGSGYTATITGMGNYTGTRTYTYNIGTDLADATVKVTNKLDNTVNTYSDSILSLPYIGTAYHKIVVQVTSSGTTNLVEGTDYTLTYSTDRTDGNTYAVDASNPVTVTISAVSGSNKYYGSTTIQYVVTSVDMSKYEDCFVITSDNGNVSSDGSMSYPYTGLSIDAALTVTYAPIDATVGDDTTTISENVLTEGTDYTLSKDTVGPSTGTGSIEITGKTNFTNSLTLDYEVSVADISGSNFAAYDSSFTDSTDQDSPSYSVEYTGEEIRPLDNMAFREKVGSSYVTLTEGTDYTVTYKDNVDVGTARCVITGMGNYTGERIVYFSITARNLSTNKYITVDSIDDVTYDGTAHTPAVSVYYDGEALTQMTSATATTGDYYVSYQDNTNPGQATVVITGANNYTGTLKKTFNIVADISNEELFEETGIVDGGTYILSGGKLYYENTSGDVLTPSEVTFTYGNGTGTLDTSNLKITSSGLTSAGTGTITATGTGSYCTGTRTFTISISASIADIDEPVFDSYYSYTGSAITPEPSIYYGGVALVKGTDYSLSYADNVDVGTASMTVTGLGNYTGTTSYTYEIRYNLNTANISEITAQSYTGSQVKPTVTVTSAGKQLTSNEDNASAADYSITYGTNVSAGTGTVTIVAVNGKSVGSQTVNFTISTNVLTADMVSAINTSYTYTGEQITPSVTVTYSGVGELKQNTDYTLSYSNNIDVGTATITITGTGNYVGTVKKTFGITAKSIAASDISVDVSDMSYAGGLALTPTVKITDTTRGAVLTEGSDYTFTASNNTVVTSDAVVTITGYGNYTGSTTAKFAINATNLSSSVITIEKNSTEYTGSAITPDFVVKCATGTTDSDGEEIYYTLQETQDYSVTYGSGTMIEAGKYYIAISSVTTNTNFTGSNTIVYTIEPKELWATGAWSQAEDEDDTDGTDAYTLTYTDQWDYTGDYVKPEVTLEDVSIAAYGGNYTMVSGVDYTLSYSNNKKAASKDDADAAPTITITGAGNYTGTLTGTFTIGEDISQGTFTATPSSYTYDGTSHVPDATGVIALDGVETTLTSGTDFTITAPEDSINAGEKTITITGDGGYYGTATATYIINPKDVTADELVIELDLSKDDNGNYYTYYTGSERTPAVTVYDTSISDTEPVDESNYTVTYVNNVNAGDESNQAMVLVSMTGNYNTGAKTQSFIINKTDISDFDFSYDTGSSKYTYTGEAITPAFTITGTTGDGAAVTLSADTDYTVEYADNVNAGEASLVVTGIGNFTGTIEETFGIYASLSDAEITIADQFYTGSALSPTPEVTCGGRSLVKGEDYTVTYYSTDGWKTIGYAVLTPKSVYFGSSVVTVSFNIISDTSLLEIAGLANEYTYTGTAIKPEVTVQTSDGTAVDCDTTAATYTNTSDGTNCINVGTVTVSVPVTTGDGSTAEVSATYAIVARDINSCTIKALEDDTYTGKSLTPPTTVSYDGNVLTTGAHYTVSYSGNKNPGVATVTYTGVGNYTGTATRSFTISLDTPKTVTAQATGTTTIDVSWKKASRVTGYRVIYQVYGQSGQKHLSTKSTSATITGLKSATTYKVGVQSYVTIGGTTYFSDVVYASAPSTN